MTMPCFTLQHVSTTIHGKKHNKTGVQIGGRLACHKLAPMRQSNPLDTAAIVGHAGERQPEKICQM